VNSDWKQVGTPICHNGNNPVAVALVLKIAGQSLRCVWRQAVIAPPNSDKRLDAYVL
jgi:hypothetical protein